jgi:iron complex outermembrane receptor protein
MIFCFILGTVMSTPLWAQTESESNVVLEEVTVTASRIEQSLQDVPVAVTALTNVDMELRNIDNTRDLQSSVPNISISANTGTASGGRIFIRGIGDDESRIGADSAVAAYVDGVYLARQTGALLDLLDLERIEVLRGPQGTLYGRNATGGAIKYQTIRPDTGANTLDLYATAGNYSRFDLKAVGNLAIGNSTAVRGSIMSKNRDGVFEAWSDGSDINEWNSTAARLALQHEFAGGWLLYAALDYVKDKSEPVPTSIPEGFDRDNDIYTLDPAEGLDCSIPAFANWSGCWEDYSSTVETTGFTMDITGPIGDFYTFKSITGYRELEDDLDSNFGIFNYQQQTDQDQFSQEFTLESGYDGPLNFIGGLYYFKEDANLDFLFALQQTLRIKTDAWAVFGEARWDITDSWRVIGGIRYTDEEKDFVGQNVTLAAVPGFSFTDKSSFDDTNYRLALQWSVTQDVMLYTSYATGFKSGGYSSDCFGPVPACFNPVDPESVKTWEVGMRSEFINNRLRLNITYFDNTYEDLQLGGSTPQGFIRFNVPEVETNGFEAEFTFAATENLTFDGYIANLKGNYVELDENSIVAIAGSDPNPKCGGQIPDEACVINNFDLKNAPEWNYMLGGTYHLQMQSGYFFNFRLSAAYEDDSYNLVANPEAVKRDETTIWDARISFANPNDTWSISLWGKNLSDEVYYPAATTVGVGAIPGIPGLAFPGQPRTYGVDFRYSFN